MPYYGNLRSITLVRWGFYSIDSGFPHRFPPKHREQEQYKCFWMWEKIPKKWDTLLCKGIQLNPSASTCCPPNKEANNRKVYRHTCFLSFSKVSGSISVAGTLDRALGESPSLDISLSLMASSSPPEDCNNRMYI